MVQQSDQSGGALLGNRRVCDVWDFVHSSSTTATVPSYDAAILVDAIWSACNLHTPTAVWWEDPTLCQVFGGNQLTVGEYLLAQDRLIRLLPGHNGDLAKTDQTLLRYIRTNSIGEILNFPWWCGIAKTSQGRLLPGYERLFLERFSVGLAEYLAESRNRGGVKSIAELARIVGLCRGQLYRMPTLRTLLILAGALGVRAQDLLPNERELEIDLSCELLADASPNTKLNLRALGSYCRRSSARHGVELEVPALVDALKDCPTVLSLGECARRVIDAAEAVANRLGGLEL